MLEYNKEFYKTIDVEKEFMEQYVAEIEKYIEESDSIILLHELWWHLEDSLIYPQVVNYVGDDGDSAREEYEEWQGKDECNRFREFVEEVLITNGICFEKMEEDDELEEDFVSTLKKYTGKYLNYKYIDEGCVMHSAQLAWRCAV